MLLVIFGAGASHDSAPEDVPREPRALAPPLAKGLVERHFDHLAEEYPLSIYVIDRLRREMTGDDPTSLETALARFANGARESDVRRQQLMAFRFYLYRVIADTTADWLTYNGNFTHYVTLLNHILEWQLTTGMPVRLATFNYDVMLDTAISNMLNRSFGSTNDYIENDEFRLFKLHGSTSWSRVLPTTMNPGTQTIDAAMTLAAEDRLPGGEIMVRPLEAHVQSARRSPPPAPQEVTIPAMAVPMAAKTEFECPRDHLDALRADLPKVSHVLIVGWRAAEPHAVELLAGTEPQEGLFPSYSLGVVTLGREGWAELAENLGPVATRARTRFTEFGGFTAFVERIDELLVGPFLAKEMGAT